MLTMLFCFIQYRLTKNNKQAMPDLGLKICLGLCVMVDIGLEAVGLCVFLNWTNIWPQPHTEKLLE